MSTQKDDLHTRYEYNESRFCYTRVLLIPKNDEAPQTMQHECDMQHVTLAVSGYIQLTACCRVACCIRLTGDVAAGAVQHASIASACVSLAQCQITTHAHMFMLYVCVCLCDSTHFPCTLLFGSNGKCSAQLQIE